MSSPVVLLSEDDDSFEAPVPSSSVPLAEETVELSSDSEKTVEYSDTNLISDDDEDLPSVNIKSKKAAIIKNLFPKSGNQTVPLPKKQFERPKVPGFEKMIGGVKVHLPVEPYGSQVALMFKVITAINKGQNCLLESPTGSGKTLALLCAALAWQHNERNRLATNLAHSYQNAHPELRGKENVVEQIVSPTKNPVDYSKLFSRPSHGEKSIYDKPDAASSSNAKRQEPLSESFEDSPNKGLVKIHKKRKLNSSMESESSSPELPSTPQKTYSPPQAETPENIRRLYSLVARLQFQTSMLVDSSVPTIYYGARTHKQLQQVIREFKRTFYCGEASMTLLASREYGCIREFDRHQWKTKNDMCRGCTKTHTNERGEKGTNCKFFDNYKALNHSSLPPAFDLDELVAKGESIVACPYYAARGMAASAQIVFCPYNYLIEPGIRSSMSIDVRDKIIIIDEAHNIEDICRDAASQTITRDEIQLAIKELEKLADYRYANQDVYHYFERLLRTLKFWDDWFGNQTPLVNSKPVNYNEAVHVWQVQHFVATLDNHNIGQQQFQDFSESAEIFCKRLREDPRTLYGVTQATGTLIESIQTVLGFLFRKDAKYLDDFVPALVKTVPNSDYEGSRNSQYSQVPPREHVTPHLNSAGILKMAFRREAHLSSLLFGVFKTGKPEYLFKKFSRHTRRAAQGLRENKETLSLRLLCMNPAVIFEGLQPARCVLLASGTLTPLISLHSELATQFPLQVSPNHVIPPDRVWIGTLSTCPNGRPLQCNSRGTDLLDTQDGLGQAVLWVCRVTPHGVLCFLPSYQLMNRLVKRWRETGIWQQLQETKHVFMESRIVRDHNDVMEDYYHYSKSEMGALLFAVYRGKVSEGMDFKDHQARAVITVGVPYPNTFDMAVKEKMKYNDKYCSQRNLLPSSEWLRVQAYRALNQAVGRCVRHRGDWGAVLLVDARFDQPYYTDHLSKWVKNFLGNNHHTFESLVNSPNSLESFMQSMTMRENEEVD